MRKVRLRKVKKLVKVSVLSCYVLKPGFEPRPTDWPLLPPH